MDKDNAVAIALQVIRRRERQTPDTADEQAKACQYRQPLNPRREDAKELLSTHCGQENLPNTLPQARR